MVLTQLWRKFTLALLAMAWCFWLVSKHTQTSPVPTPNYSFLSSLHWFLLKHAGHDHALSVDHFLVDAVATAEEADSLDQALRKREMISARLILNVYVYEMPAKFTTDLLWLFHNTLKEIVNLTSNGSPVHRLIEQHSVEYWLYSDLMAPERDRLLKHVRRVREPAEADVFYIPFFTTIPFFLLERPQCKKLYREAVKWLTGQAAWQRSGGRDHVLAVHHPWSMKSHRRLLKSAIWLLPDLDSSGNWYKEGEVSLEKDVVMPYVANVEACDPQCLTTSAPLRKTLLFFRGRTNRNAPHCKHRDIDTLTIAFVLMRKGIGQGGKVRSKLAAVLQHEKDVVIQEGSIGKAGKLAAQNGMRRSLFCLSPAGDTPSSARLFDAIVSGCIPVVVSDELELPFEGILDFRKALVFVPEERGVEKGWLVNYLRGKTPQEIAAMQLHLAQYMKHFQYATPAQPFGPEDFAWRMVAGKLQNIRLHTCRSQRLVSGARSDCSCHCTHVNETGFFIN